jgi:hypothetical protein
LQEKTPVRANDAIWSRDQNGGRNINVNLNSENVNTVKHFNVLSLKLSSLRTLLKKYNFIYPEPSFFYLYCKFFSDYLGTIL